MQKSKILFDRILELRMNKYIKDKKIARFLDKILIFMENQTTKDIEYTYEKVFGPPKSKSSNQAVNQ